MASVRALVVIAVWMICCGTALLGQGGPALVTPTSVVYPPIARAAHVSGDAVVQFSIGDDGQTRSIVAESGPVMLKDALAGQIRNWRFSTPLPLGSARDWVASFRFSSTTDEDVQDAVDGPPWKPCCGDSIQLDTGPLKVTGTVISSDGSQHMAVDGPPAPSDNCPKDQNRKPPVDHAAGDFVELDRRGSYRVRVSRSGLAEWTGSGGVAVSGERQFTVAPATADKLMEMFSAPEFWSLCSAAVPPERDEDGDVNSGEFLTAQIGDEKKSVSLYDFRSEHLARRYAWSMDVLSDSHKFRHGDSFGELLRNMYQDIEFPKPGITALMRATDHYNSATAQRTYAALKYQIAQGADLEAVDESGWTALMYAASLNDDCCEDTAVKLLVEAHANVNHPSLHGETPLMAVAYNGYVSGTLLKAGADINARNADGVTALMLLAQQQRPEAITEALAAGADATAQDLQGRSALDYLRQAACDRAIVPLPVASMLVVLIRPEGCPPNTVAYRESEAALKKAIKPPAPK